MTKYVAFLRAVNVGGRTVKMEQLRRLFEGMGLSGVETFIASGNVIFDSNSKSPRTLEKKIEGRLRQALGYEVRTFIRSLSELERIARYEPFQDAGRSAHALYVAFLSGRPGAAAKERLMAFNSKVDDLHAYGREVYWRCRKKMSESDFSGAVLEKALSMPATLRNATTVGRIAAKYGRAAKS